MQCLWFWNQFCKSHIGVVSKLFMHGSLNIKNRIINAPKWVQWSTTTSPARLCESIRLSGQNQLRLIEHEFGSIILFHWRDRLGKWRFCRTCKVACLSGPQIEGCHFGTRRYLQGRLLCTDLSCTVRNREVVVVWRWEGGRVGKPRLCHHQFTRASKESKVAVYQENVNTTVLGFTRFSTKALSLHTSRISKAT